MEGYVIFLLFQLSGDLYNWSYYVIARNEESVLNQEKGFRMVSFIL